MRKDNRPEAQRQEETPLDYQQKGAGAKGNEAKDGNTWQHEEKGGRRGRGTWEMKTK